MIYIRLIHPYKSNIAISILPWMKMDDRFAISKAGDRWISVKTIQLDMTMDIDTITEWRMFDDMSALDLQRRYSL